MPSPIFHRQDLAVSLANRLLKPSLLETTVRDGLFITGSRRIGKTTFLQQDLIPALEQQGALVIYVDLWKNRESPSPTKAVLNAVHNVLRSVTSSETLVKEFKIGFGPFSVSFSPEKVGTADGVPLADAFLEISQKISCNIVLIIDEIQETLKSESGRNLLMALKAARDAVNLRANNTSDTYLLIVGTGSHRSFVSAMASRPSQPFYLADRINYPKLSNEFIIWAESELSKKYKLPDTDTMQQGFEILDSRPLVFFHAIQDIQSYSGLEFNQAFLAICSARAKSDAREFLENILGEDNITKFLFTEIAAAGPSGRDGLFTRDFCKYLSNKLNKNTIIQPSAIQSRLEKMSNKNWIYPIGYGCYSISDTQAGKVWLADIDEYFDFQN